MMNFETEIQKLQARVAALEAKQRFSALPIDEQFAQVHAAIEDQSTQDDPSVADTGKPWEDTPLPSGLVPRGKYAGKSHDQVVQLDPQHVVWLFDNGKEAGLGYTAAQVAEARELLKTRPAPRLKSRYLATR